MVKPIGQHENMDFFSLYFFLFFHLDWAAFWAISLRFADERLAARALPPFSPPSLPSSTAAGFFSLIGSGNTFSFVVTATIRAASWFMSSLGFLERLGMVLTCHKCVSL